jgi:tetratricopeptide (TPR) repeat protein
MDRTVPTVCALTVLLSLGLREVAAQEPPVPSVMRLPSAELDGAIERYSALIRLTREAGQRVDAEIESGYDQFLLGDYGGAAKTLEASLPNLAPGYFMPYRVLGVSYEKIGLPVDAEAAYENAVSMYPNDPFGWNAIRRLHAHEGSAARVVQRPRWKNFPSILALGNPADWSSANAVRGVAAYGKYVEELTPALDALSVQNIARGASLYALKAAEDAGKAGNYADGISVIAAFDTSGLGAKVPLAIRRAKDGALIGLYLHMRANLSAAATLDRLARSPDGDPAEDAKLLLPILYATFDSVSWDPESGKRRTNDPADFLDLSSKYRDEFGRPTKPTRATLELPYGMNNPHEDTATIGENIAANFDLMRMLRDRITKRNFELPVKVFIHRLLDTTTGLGSPMSEGPFAELRGLLEAAFAAAQDDNIPVSTRDAFDVALLVDDLLRDRPLRAPLPF